MRATLIIGLILITGIIKGQYPFEKYPAITCKEYKNWITYDRLEKEHRIHRTLSIPRFFNADSITIQLTFFDTLDYSLIRIFKNKNQIQKLIESDAFYGITTPSSIYVADFNGDSLMDIKLFVPNYGCGGYNFYVRVIYLLQKPDGNFNKISFTDLFMDFKNRLERDFDGDGFYEVITQTFQNYQNHNYWLFDLYDFKNDSLVNVNYKDNYPIMIQLLNRENYEVTSKISREKMKDFTRKLPSDFKKQ